MKALVLALLLTFSLGSLLAPDRCSPLGLKCVGEGESCLADSTSYRTSYTNIPDVCSGSTVSLCRICSDETLVCHEGTCLKRTQGVDERCNNQQHQYCMANLVCSNPNGNGQCYDPLMNAPTQQFAQNGEDCIRDSDCYYFNQPVPMTCDPFTKKCRLPHIVDLSDNECSYTPQCPFGMWCQPGNPSLGVGSRCMPRVTLPEGTACISDEQCGIGSNCWPFNSDEAHAEFQIMTCQKRWTRGEGSVCTGSSGTCQKDLICWSGRCIKPDYNVLGDGCQEQNECGRGMTCECPRTGAGRMRCNYDGDYQDNTWEYEYEKRENALYQCAMDNGCQWIDWDWVYVTEVLRMGSCGSKHCQGVFAKFLELDWPMYNKCPSEWKEDYYQDYQGMDQSWNSASQHAPVFAVLVLSVVALFAMH